MSAGGDRTSFTDPDLGRLKWFAVLATLLFLALIEVLRRTVLDRFFDSWFGNLALIVLVLGATIFFSFSIFGVIQRMQERLRRQNQELLALHESGLAITSELELEPVLQRIVDEARELVGARYGALALLRVDGGMEAFLTSGITQQERELLGPIPQGHGLLGLVITEGEALRLADLTRHPRSVGFPANHPVMHSLVAVPIVFSGHNLGALYLTEKMGATAFGEEDQQRLERFATPAALAIENARLHRQVRALAIAEERERIAREMHDSIAQVLGYVNTKAQAAQQLLATDQSERAATHIAQLSQAAREAYADVRENIFGLRTTLDSERDFLETVKDYLEHWQDHSGISAVLSTQPVERFQVSLSPLAELQLLRIIQEALTNVRKHAAATRVEVTLERAGTDIIATIVDNGAGFDPEAGTRSGFPRFGLATMRERAQAVGGEVEISSQPTAGTTVRARIPMTRTTVPQTREHDASAHR